MSGTTRHIVLGGTGNVGSAAAGTLLAAGEQVTLVAHDDAKVGAWEDRGAEVAVVDIADTDALRDLLRSGDRAFLLNPPADPSTDTDAVERATARSIAEAVRESGLEKVVVASTYGAQPGERIGDLSVLHEFEQMLEGTGPSVAVTRGAYYLTNWDHALEAARDEGVVPSMFPADFALPMVDPADLGAYAARRLVEPIEAAGLRWMEGPERCTPRDVADAFATFLQRPVSVAVVGPDEWESTFLQMGFSPAAADAYTRMTAASQEPDLELPDEPERGRTSLVDHVERLVAASGS